MADEQKHVQKSRGKAIALGLCLAGIVYFVARSAEPRRVQEDGGYRIVMGTAARIMAVAPDAETAKRSILAGFTELDRVDRRMSDYKPESELSMVNRNAYPDAVKVSDELFGVLAASVDVGRQTEGAFDITVGPLVDLYRQDEKQGHVPGDEEIAAAREKVGIDKLILDANEKTVRFAVEDMRLDLGGIAKGYAIDRAVEVMKTVGASGGMVDVGGDIRCFGRPAKKRQWLIGLQDPAAVDANGEDIELTSAGAKTGKPLLVLKLNNAAVATSGDYRRFTLIEGRKFSHIIDTSKGAGADKLTSVSVIAATAAEADALATAVSVLGSEKGFQLIKQRPNVEAIILPKESIDILATEGAQKYISNGN